MDKVTSYEAAKAIGELMGVDLLTANKVVVTLESGQFVALEMQVRLLAPQIGLDPLREQFALVEAVNDGT
jgi:hypothetical protein